MIVTIGLVCLLAGIRAESVTELHPEQRIVGGSATTIEDHPYQLSMMRSGSHTCGASIIGPYWAVTAAHCFNRSTSEISFRAGSTSRITGGTVHTALQIIVHEAYNYTTNDYDIAVIKVNTPFPIGSSTVQTIKLPVQGLYIPANTSVVISGWGTTSPGGTALPNILQEVYVAIVDDQKCNATYEKYGVITDRMICAGDRNGHKDACLGDSGGPLVANISGSPMLTGLVSWGVGCGLPEYPGVYTKVSSLRNWIRDKTKI